MQAVFQTGYKLHNTIQTTETASILLGKIISSSSEIYCLNIPLKHYKKLNSLLCTHKLYWSTMKKNLFKVLLGSLISLLFLADYAVCIVKW